MILTKILSALAAAALLAGCATAPPPAPGGPEFRPERYFLGGMRSSGTLAVGLGGPRPLHVDSQGRATGPDALVLDQVVHRGGAPDARRSWTMRRLAGGGYEATLTEAAGRVRLEAAGSRVHLRYRIAKATLSTSVEQWMDLQPDGRTVRNVGVFRVLGIVAGRLDETIVHDPS